MKVEEFLSSLSTDIQKDRLNEIIQWVMKTFPNGHFEVKWNQPMFLYNKTFIIGFSVAKNHITVGTEGYDLDLFREVIEKTYKVNKMTFIIKNNQPIDFDLLKEFIEFKIDDKKDTDTFWK